MSSIAACCLRIQCRICLELLLAEFLLPELRSLLLYHLRLWFLKFNEGVQLVKVHVCGYAPFSYFSLVVDCSLKYVFVLSTEKVLNSGSWDFMLVYGFILEEDYVAHLWNLSLFFLGNNGSPSCIFLFPERVEGVEDNFPPRDLMLNWYDRRIWVSWRIRLGLRQCFGSGSGSVWIRIIWSDPDPYQETIDMDPGSVKN